MRRKCFTAGEAVEIARDTSHYIRPSSWESATYVKSIPDMRGWHMVGLAKGKERRINAMSGMETSADDPQSYVSDRLLVPSRRIRSATANSP